MAGKKHLIIGAGSAGLNAAEEIRRISAEDVIKIVSAEDFAPYSPTVLPYLLSGRIDESTLAMRQEGYFERLNATFVRGKEAIRIFPEKKEVLFRDGEREAYDALLIAAGADSSRPEIKGLGGGYQGIHTLDDCRRLLQRLRGNSDVAILGAGLVAVEVAIALAERGCRVTLIVRSRILRVYFDENADGIIKDILTANGIHVLYRKGVEAVKRSGEKVEIAFPDGEPLAADELLICTGVRARMGFVTGSGIKVNEGIIVDRRMQTTIEGIYAAGDIAEAPDFFTGRSGMNQIVETAMDGGRVAGSNMAGIQAEYEGWISSNVFHFFGHTSFTAGLAQPAGDGYEILAEKDAGKARYKKLVFKDNRLVGTMLIDVECDPGVLLYLIREKVDLEEEKRQLFEKPQETSRRLMLQAEKRQGASIEDHRSKLR